MKMFFDAIKRLGFKNGLRYYRIYVRAKKNPSIIEDWASSCQAAAMDEKNPELKKALQDWAIQLRTHLRKYHENVPKNSDS